MDENAFRFAKLVGYKAFADLAGKGSIFVVTVVAARRLTADAFGIFSLAVAPALSKLSYDSFRDLTAVSQVASVPLLMFAGGKTPFNSVAGAVATARIAPRMQ